jgi:hypothetical protein
MEYDEMKSFDDLARSLATRRPRRGFLRTAIGAVAGAGLFRLKAASATAQEAGSVGVECVPCNCAGDSCDCCISGITGGGVVRTDSGDVTLVLFATLLADAPQDATGFVRWLDPQAEGGLNLESIGPVAYDWDEGNEQVRNVRGLMTINGQEEQPFVLEIFDAGPGLVGQDTARLLVGNATAGSSGSFGYQAAGTLVGGDIQLLDTVAPVPTS